MSTSGPAAPINILLIEDDSADIRLTREALADSKVSNELFVATSGPEALKLLRGEGAEAVPRPDLILLDLNMPGMNGREVLEELKNDPVLQTIPVTVLTTSQAEEDIVRSYELRANAYVTKPVDLDQFLKVVRSVEEFWFQVVRLPPEMRK